MVSIIADNPELNAITMGRPHHLMLTEINYEVEGACACRGDADGNHLTEIKRGANGTH